MSGNDNLAHRPNVGSSLAAPAFLDADTGAATPSGLTPGTRSEAEAAFNFNATQQTDSAAAASPPPHDPKSPVLNSTSKEPRRRPLAPPRSGSNNYLDALREDLKVKELEGVKVEYEDTTRSSGAGGAGQGLTAGDKENLQASLPGSLDRQQSWNGQDKKRVLQQRLVGDGATPGYDSTSATQQGIQ